MVRYGHGAKNGRSTVSIYHMERDRPPKKYFSPYREFNSDHFKIIHVENIGFLLENIGFHLESIFFILEINLFT